MLVYGKSAQGTENVSKYQSFYIDSETNKYKIHFNETLLTGIHSFSNPENDGRNINGMEFKVTSGDPCVYNHGPNWYNHCSNLHTNKNVRLIWHGFAPNNEIDMKQVEWMIKEM